MTPSTSIRKKIGIASLIMMGSVFLSRFMGLFRDMVIAYIGGTSAEVDAYQVAFLIPEILNHVLASGFLSVTIIPLFSKYLAQGQQKEGYALCNAILTVFGGLLAGFIILTYIFAFRLVPLFAPGIENPDVIAKAVKMTRIIIPAQFFFFAGGLFTAVQFAHEEFKLPALAPLIYNLGIIVGGAVLGPFMGMEGFSWGVLGGAFFGNFLLQYYGARRKGYLLKWNFNLHHPDVKKYVVLILPLTVGMTMTFSTEFLIRFFGSYLPRGNIAGINYAFRILLMLVGFFGQAVGVASYPYLARFVAEDKMDEMNRLFNDTLKALTVVIPISFLIMVLRHEVVAILFQHGEFDAQSTRITTEALVFLMLGAYAFAAQTIVVRGFFAVQDTLSPAIFGTVAVVFSLPLYYFGIHLMGIGGLSLAVSLSAYVQIFLIYTVWNKKVPNPGQLSVYKTIVKMAALALPVGVFLEWVRIHSAAIFYFSPLIQNLFVALSISGLFFAIFLFFGYVLKMREIKQVIDGLAGFIKSRN